MADKLEKSKTGYYAANQGFATTYEGQPLFVQNGELVHKDHPLLKGREDLFVPAEQLTRFDDPKVSPRRPEIEQATAAPGEKRGRRRRMSESEVAEPEVEAPAEEPAPEAEPEPEAAPEEDGDGEAEA